MSKTKEQILLYGALLLAVGTLVYALFAVMGNNTGSSNIGSSNSGNAPKTSPNLANGFETIGSGSTDQGEVSIELTPVNGEKGFRVMIAANTHSVDLSQFDLRKITTLEYGGKEIQPIAAPDLSGHHSTGELVFDAEVPSGFTIRIRGIPKEEERVFTWR